MDPLSIASYSHLAFRVHSLERSRAYYARLFGYDPFLEMPLEHAALGSLTGGVTSKATLAMGMLGDKVIELVEYDGLPAEQIGFSHFGLRVDDVDAACRRARELEAPILVGPTDIEGTRVMFVEDPDGNRLELGEFAEWPPAADEPDEAPVTLELSASEHRELRDAAAGEPLAAYVRRLVLRDLARRRS